MTPPLGVDRRAIIHIGWPKTATTSMQQQLRSWPNLAGRPWNRPGGAAAKALLRSFVDGGPDRSDELDALLEASWLDRRVPVILSDESIIRLPGPRRDPSAPGAPTGPDAWASSTWERVVLATLREPRGLLRSAYRQKVRAGDPRTYRRFLSELLAELQLGTGSFAIERHLTAWRDLVGPDHLVITWYEDYVTDPATFWRHLAVACSVPALAAIGDKPAVHLNSGTHGPWWFERWLNVVLAPHQRKRRSALGLRLRRFYNHDLAHRLPPGRHELGADCPSLEDEVVAALDHELDRVCERFGTRRPSTPTG